MKTPKELKDAFPGQAAKFLDDPDHNYGPEHLQAALVNAFRQIDGLEREITRLAQLHDDPSSNLLDSI